MRGSRRLVQISVANEHVETKDSIDRLMGNKPELRFQFIQENAEFASDLDI